MPMKSESWLLPHLTQSLRRRQSVLSSWRDQQPTLGGRIRNFENWLLVELVHELVSAGFEVRTNGQFDERKVAPANVPNLSGRKALAKNLSADLAVRSGSRTYSAEIKTGLDRARILDDLRIVKHYHDAKIANRCELAWVTLMPRDSGGHASALKSVSRTISEIQREHGNVILHEGHIGNLLTYRILVPQ